jgi:TolB-like protein/Tfp pilus assembly protein PilF
MLAPDAFQRRSERVAVLDFEAIGSDAALPALARSLADQIVAVMSTSDLQTAPRADSESFRGEQLPRAARAANVAFVLDGTIRQDADNLRVSMHVIDARANLTLWSNTYERASADAAALQEQVAAHAAGILRCALISRRPRAGAIDPQTLSIFLRACDRVANFDRPPEEMVTIARQVTERAPRFSRGWSMLAMAAAFASRGAAAGEADALIEVSREAAERARRLDRNNAEILLAEAVALPPIGNWSERQDLITRALELEPESADAFMLQGELLAEQGRLNEALTYFRRALAIEPLSPSYLGVTFSALGAVGRLEEAMEYNERLLRVWPDSPSGLFNRFTSQTLVGDPREALAMIDPPNPTIRLPSATHASWRRWLVARRDRNHEAGRAATHEIAALARRGEMDLPRAVVIASVSGELDLAFELTREHFRRGARVAQPIAGAGRYFQFMPAATPMRRDPRFIAVMREAGLVAHWLETDRWPDFCVTEQIPYDCEEEARRVS